MSSSLEEGGTGRGGGGRGYDTLWSMAKSNGAKPKKQTNKKTVLTINVREN